MHNLNDIRKKNNALNCCVIIPTYNNGATIEDIIRRTLEFTDHLIVVNDGSTDSTPEILKNLLEDTGHAKINTANTEPCALSPEPFTLLTIPVNTGKGWALRQGFDHAIRKGFRYAITIDSDGQHFPEDIPVFIEKISIEPDSIVLGSRNMDQDAVPGTSNFGHKFSVFWFKVETGLKIPDVQTGFRLYPLDKVKEIKHLYTRKYEFEVEILVRLAWRRVRVLSVPVRVYYAPKGIRVSHFRKFRDFARVSLVNTIFVFMALLWVRPLSFIREVRRKSFKAFIREYILESKDSNAKLAWSVVLGAFIAVMPVWGWQMAVAVALAYFFKLNKVVALAASNLSIPPMLPVILFLSYYSGGLVLGLETNDIHYGSGINFEWIKQNLVQYVVGSFVFGFVLAPVLGLITYILLRIFRKKKPKEAIN